MVIEGRAFALRHPHPARRHAQNAPQPGRAIHPGEVGAQRRVEFRVEKGGRRGKKGEGVLCVGRGAEVVDDLRDGLPIIRKGLPSDAAKASRPSGRSNVKSSKR